MNRWVQWSAKQPVKIVWASLTPSLDVARQDCLLHRFFANVSKSSDKHVEFKRKVTFKSFLNLLYFKFYSFDYSRFIIVPWLEIPLL